MSDLGLNENEWLEILRSLNILLNTEWKTAEELKRLDKSALEKYCEPWATATERLDDFVNILCEDLNDKGDLDSSNLLHEIYKLVKTLSPVFYTASGVWSSAEFHGFNCVYAVLHPDSEEYKQHLKKPDDIKIGEKFADLLNDGLGTPEKLEINRTKLLAILQEIRSKKSELTGDLGLTPSSLRERFTLRNSQVLFDGQDLNVGAGAAVEILIALVKNFNSIVPFKELLDENSSQTDASEKLRKAIERINKALKSNSIPAVVENRKAEGYIMLPTDR